jgi:hypothetical protein
MTKSTFQFITVYNQEKGKQHYKHTSFGTVDVFMSFEYQIFLVITLGLPIPGQNIGDKNP